MKAPTLKTLKSRDCTLEELQAALVKIIEKHNELHDEINKMITSGRIASPAQALSERRYGL